MITLRRILVALDASPDSLSALQAALSFARLVNAEIEGLFVEDTLLLELADSPFAAEIAFTAQGQPLSRARMEAKLRSQSARARRLLADAASAANIPWSFRSVRGRVSAELLAAAARADLLALGRAGWSQRAPARLGSTAAALFSADIPLLLFSSRPAPQPPDSFLLHEGAPALPLDDGFVLGNPAIRAALPWLEPALRQQRIPLLLLRRSKNHAQPD